jgi:small subunit ribosomal protein S9
LTENTEPTADAATDETTEQPEQAVDAEQQAAPEEPVAEEQAAEAAAEPEAVEPDTAAEEQAEGEQPERAPKPSVISLAADARYRATGKRKSAIARVILRPGKGSFEINGRSLDDYLPREVLRVQVKSPLELVGYAGKIDVVARVHGGGVSAQAGALRHGIAKALVEAEPTLRGQLKSQGFLTRDARVKERKKAGLKKARKRPQFSKR